MESRSLLTVLGVRRLVVMSSHWKGWLRGLQVGDCRPHLCIREAAPNAGSGGQDTTTTLAAAWCQDIEMLLKGLLSPWSSFACWSKVHPSSTPWISSSAPGSAFCIAFCRHCRGACSSEEGLGLCSLLPPTSSCQPDLSPAATGTSCHHPL